VPTWPKADIAERSRVSRATWTPSSNGWGGAGGAGGRMLDFLAQEISREATPSTPRARISPSRSPAWPSRERWRASASTSRTSSETKDDLCRFRTLGCGKSTLIRRVLSRLDGVRSPSRTRPGKGGSRRSRGRTIILSPEQFLRWSRTMPSSSGRLSTAPTTDLPAGARASGDGDVILDIDVQGAAQVREKIRGPSSFSSCLRASRRFGGGSKKDIWTARRPSGRGWPRP